VGVLRARSRRATATDAQTDTQTDAETVGLGAARGLPRSRSGALRSGRRLLLLPRRGSVAAAAADAGPESNGNVEGIAISSLDLDL
jgi:hypothetical protein